MGNTEGTEQQQQGGFIAQDRPGLQSPTAEDQPSAFTTFVSNIFKSDEQPQDQPSVHTSNPNLARADYSGFGSNVRLEKSVADEKGWLTIKISKGFSFSKKDSTRCEIGLVDPKTNAWNDPNNVRSSQVFKPGENPILNFDYVAHYDRTQSVKIVFYGIEKPLVGKEKEYILGTCKLDYQFFRAWYLQGKLTTEKKVALAAGSDKDFKGTRHIGLILKYEGPSLAQDKEFFGSQLVGGPSTSGSGKGKSQSDIAREFNAFMDDTAKMFDDEINEASDAINPFGGVGGKARAARMGAM